MDYTQPTFKKVTWQEVREQLLPLNSELVEIIDDLAPGDECALYKASYLYGDAIIKNGEFFIANEKGKLASLFDRQFDSALQEDLGYNLRSNPVGITLTNTSELFALQPDRILPLGGLIPPGALVGLYRILTGKQSHQPKFTWEMTAGARSIFMLPKVAEREKFKRLKRTFNLMSDKPKSMLDHWSIFREITSHPEFSQQWSTEIVYFSKNWFSHLDDKAWQAFNYYLYRHAWNKADYWRNQVIWNLIFSIIQKETNMRSNSFIADTIKCLFSIAVGGAPGFHPAIDNMAGPIEGLQKVYHEVYGLKNYLPIIMTLGNFNLNSVDPRPLYYSLQFPTATEFSPKSSKHSSLLTDLYDLTAVLEKYLDILNTNAFNIEETPLAEALRSVCFDFFHNNPENYHQIRSSENIPKEDGSFLQCFSHEPGAEFPAAAAFLKGCVRIAKCNHE